MSEGNSVGDVGGRSGLLLAIVTGEGGDAALGEAYFERRISFSTPTVSIVSLLESKNKQTSCVAAMALIISAF